jgi:hypothetical protein
VRSLLVDIDKGHTLTEISHTRKGSSEGLDEDQKVNYLTPDMKIIDNTIRLIISRDQLSDWKEQFESS